MTFRFLRPLIAFVLMLAPLAPIWGQQKGEPDKFDFYLLNLSWSPEFCSIKGTSPQCNAGRGFIVHGLWPQNVDGSYPVYCSTRPGPAHPEANLDITPDLSLLKHEWEKHGTCTTLAPERFFDAERKASQMIKTPSVLQKIDHEIQMTPNELLNLYAKENPGFPEGSILLSCGNNRLTAIEACFTKDLKPMQCQGLRSCKANVVKISPPQSSK